MLIYLVKMLCGSYEDKVVDIIYVGTSFDDASKKCMEYHFPDDSNQWGVVETWENGKRIKEEYLRD